MLFSPSLTLSNIASMSGLIAGNKQEQQTQAEITQGSRSSAAGEQPGENGKNGNFKANKAICAGFFRHRANITWAIRKNGHVY